MAADTYRGWNISFDFPPIPVRDFDWSATHPDYDPAPQYADDGPSDHRVVHAASRETLIAEIDLWIEENEQ